MEKTVDAVLEIASRITPCWLAGFFDGEGSISGGFNKQPRSDGLYHKVPRLHVGLAQKNLLLLSLIREQYGGGIRPQFTRGEISCYDLMWYGRSVRPLLLAIRDHVVIKRKQVEIALRFLELTGTKTQCPVTGRNMPLSPEILAERTEMVYELRRLNRQKLSDAKRLHYERTDSTTEPVLITR